MSKVLPTADSARTWTPSLGNVYQSPASDDATPPAAGKSPTTTTTTTTTKAGPGAKIKDTSLEAELQRLAEESFFRHLKYGGDYIDEKPITGQPGNFHVASGRKEKAGAANKPPALPTLPKTDGGIGGLGLATATTAAAAAVGGKGGKEEKKGKTEKSPRPGNAPKPKRKKSKAGTTPTPTSA